MKNLIVQTYYHHGANKADTRIGCYVPADELAAESEARFRKYAESIGADYVMIDKAPYAKYPQPAWARFAALDMCIEQGYDNVLYVDADIIPSKKVLGVNIFDVPGIAKKTERDEGSKHEWHVNAGVFKLTRKECFKMRSQVFAKPNLRWLEQTGKNQDPFNNMYKKGVGRKPAFLDPIWNMTRPYHRTEASVEGGYFAHFIGHQKINGNQWGFVGRDPIAWEDWGTGWVDGFMSQYKQFKDMSFEHYEYMIKTGQYRPKV